MRDPYKVIVWGPGAVGQAALREMVDRPEFHIVGVFGYSPSKIGKDVGEIIGHEPFGVKITNDKEAILALKADVVLYTGAFPIDTEPMERDIIAFLESGKNVVTAAAHFYPQSHGKAYVDRIEAACRKGGTSLFGTGENPGFWWQNVAMTLTSVCTHVEHLKLEEFGDLGKGGSSVETLESAGFNKTVEEASAPGPVAELWRTYYYVEALTLASRALFRRDPEKIDIESIYHPAPRDIVLTEAAGDQKDMFVPKGKVGAFTHRFSAQLDGRPRLTIEVNWFLKLSEAPFPVQKDYCWRIQLEGKPVSLSCEFVPYASLKDESLFRPGDPIPSVFYVTAMPLVHAIPLVCAHAPGIVLPSVFTHVVPDFRLLEQRTPLGA